MISKLKKKCLRHKLQFRLKEDAVLYIKNHPNKKRYSKLGPMVPYRCGFCNRYHIGHPVQIKKVISKFGSWDNAVKKMGKEDIKNINQVLRGMCQ